MLALRMFKCNKRYSNEGKRNKTVIFSFLTPSKKGRYAVRLYIHIFLMLVQPIFFRRMLQFWQFFFVGNISASWWSRFKNFLNPHVVNLSVFQFNILFGYNFRKNRTMARKSWYVFELHRFALHMKNCYCVLHGSFYRALQKFQYIDTYSVNF